MERGDWVTAEEMWRKLLKLKSRRCKVGQNGVVVVVVVVPAVLLGSVWK